jgi:hypothetical protein
MSRSHAGAPPAPRTVAAAMPHGSQEFVRRLVFYFMLFSMFSVFSPLSYTAEAATATAIPPAALAAGTSSLGATQDPVAAWSCRGVYHVVGRGETIYSIARRYGTSAYRIAVCNGLASYTVYVGQTLLVPTARS